MFSGSAVLAADVTGVSTATAAATAVVVPAVGNTVDLKTAEYENSIGTGELQTVWSDPEFDPTVKAFYYVRVIEIPTPRWVLFDAIRYNLTLPDEVTLVAQERAYTSPIWYHPKA